jgi:spermidine/putrescine transport system permease protein
MDHWTSKKSVFATVFLPGTLWLLLFFLVPLAYVWLMSFGEKSGIVDIVLTWTSANYLRALESIYLEIIWKSVWISALATALCLVLSFPVAFAISFAQDRWKPLLLLIVILPFWINLLIRTYALIAVFRTRGHVNFGLEWLWQQANALLALVGLGEYRLLGESFEPLTLLYNDFAVIAGLTYVYMPFMVLPIYATLERLDRSFIEASLDLGASQARTLFSVVVPLAMPGIVSGVILVFIPCLGSFLTPDLLGGTSSQMIGNVIERQFKSANDWPFGAALSFLLMYVTFGALAMRSLLAGRRDGMAV